MLVYYDINSYSIGGNYDLLDYDSNGLTRFKLENDINSNESTSISSKDENNSLKVNLIHNENKKEEKTLINKKENIFNESVYEDIYSILGFELIINYFI